MNEVGNFLKNVLPRLVGKPAQDALDSLDISLTDKDGNLKDVIGVYTEVANKVKEISNAERISITEGLAGKFHISRMQALLDDLGSADSMYRSMYETSKNSAGSAIEENDKYMKSLQARINLSRVELEKLALAFGEAFLTESIIQMISAFGSLMGGIAKTVEVLGGLPVILGTASIALALLSTRFSGLMISIGQASSAYLKMGVNAVRSISASTPPTVVQTQAINVLSTSTLRASMSMDKMSASTIGATNAARMLTASAAGASIATQSLGPRLQGAGAGGLSAATGFRAAASGIGAMLASAGLIGLAFVAVGAALEAFMSKARKHRELQESIRLENEELVRTYKENREEIEKLASSYNALNNKIVSGDNSDETSLEYLNVQKELAKLLPSVVIGENEKGEAILASNEVVKEHIALLKEQIAIENAKKLEKDIADSSEKFELAETDFTKAEDSLSSFIDGATSRIDSLNKVYQDKLKFLHIDPSALKSYDDVVDSLTEVKKRMEDIRNSSDGDSFKDNSEYLYLEGMSNQLSLYEEQYRIFMQEKLSASQKMQAETRKQVVSYISGNLEMSDSNRVLVTDLLSIGITGEESAEKLNKIQEIASKIGFTRDMEEDIQNLDKAIDDLANSSEDDFDKFKTAADNAFEIFKQDVLNSSNLAVGSEAWNVLSESLDKTKVSKFELITAAKELSDVTGMNYEDAVAAVRAYDEMGDSVDDVVKNMETLMSSISSINKVLEDYQKNNELSTTTLMNLIEKYPDLIDYIDDEAELIRQLESIRDDDIKLAEQQMIAKLSTSEEYYKRSLVSLEKYYDEHFKFYQGDLTQFKTLAEAKAEVETQLISTLAEQWGVYYDKVSQTFMDAPTEPTELNHSFFLPGTADAVNKANKELLNFKDTWDNFTLDKIDLGLDKIGTSMEKGIKSTKDSTKAQKEANKAMEEYIFLTDKYKRALEELDLEIKKQQDIKSKFLEHSKQHQDALNKELKLERDKLKLMQDQTKALDAQIKSGKIAQTGIVTTSSETKVKPSGFGGRITSQYGMRQGGFHNGIDIASPLGTRQDSNANGKVVRTFKTGEYGTYGNGVIVQDEKGMQHLFAHLDKIAVEVGDAVSAGMQIGTVGSTGRSSGPHLHYEYRDQSGKAQNPTSMVEAARKGISSASKDLAQVQQGIDNAQSELISMKGQIIDQKGLVSKLEISTINSVVSGFEYSKSTNDKQLENSENKLKKMSSASQEYRDELDKQQDILTRKQGYNQQEIDFINEMIKQGGLSAVTVEELNEKLHQLGLEKNAMQFASQDTYTRSIDSMLKSFDDDIESINNSMEYSQTVMTEYEEGSRAYLSHLHLQKEALKEKAKLQLEEVKTLENMIDTQELSAEQVADYRKQIASLGNAYQGTLKDIREATDAIVDFNTQALIDISEKNIESYEMKISLLGTVDTAEEKERVVEYTSEIGKELETQAKNIADRISHIKLKLSSLDTDKAPEKVAELEKQLKQLTNKKHEVKLEIVHNIEETIKLLNEIDVDKLEKAFDKGNWQSVKPVTLDGQKKYNEYLKEQAKALDDASKAQEDYQRLVEKTKLDKLLENADSSLREIMDVIDLVDHQLALNKDGKANIPDINYGVAPKIKPMTPEEAAALVPLPEQKVEFEFEPPKTFVDFINEEFSNALESSAIKIDEIRQKIKDLGQATPENKEQFLGYYKEMSDEVTKLGSVAEKAKESLKLKLELGQITQADFDLMMQQIKAAELNVIAIPKLQMSEEAISGIRNIGVKLANNLTEGLRETVDNNRLSLDLLSETEAQEQAESYLRNIENALREAKDKIVSRIKEIQKEMKTNLDEEQKIQLEAELGELRVDLGDINSQMTAVQAEIDQVLGVDTKHTHEVEPDTKKIDEKIKELKKPTDSTHKFIPDTNAIDSAISQIQQDTSSTHTIYQKTVSVDSGSDSGSSSKSSGGNSSAGSKLGGWGNILGFFSEGTKSHLGGYAVVGEYGKELVVNPDGSNYLVGENGMEIKNIQRGAMIVPNDETERILKGQPLPNYADGVGALSKDKKADDAVLKALGNLASAVEGNTLAIARLSSVIKEHPLDEIYNAEDAVKYVNDNADTMSRDEQIEFLKRAQDKMYNTTDITTRTDMWGKQEIITSTRRDEANKIDETLQKFLKPIESFKQDNQSTFSFGGSRGYEYDTENSVEFLIKDLANSSYLINKERAEIAQDFVKGYDDFLLAQNPNLTDFDWTGRDTLIGFIEELANASDDVVIDYEKFKRPKDKNDSGGSSVSGSSSGNSNSAPKGTLIDVLNNRGVITWDEFKELNETQLLDLKAGLTQDLIDKATEINESLFAELDKLENKNADGTYKDTESNKALADKIQANMDAQKQAQIVLKGLVKERYEAEWKLLELEERRSAIVKRNIDFYSELKELISPSDIDSQIVLGNASISNEKSNNSFLKTALSDLKTQRDLLEEGSYEWGLINDKVEEYEEKLQESSLSLANQIKNNFKRQMDKELDNIEKKLFDGKTEEEARKALDKKYKLQDLYVDGLEKELEVEKLIEFARKSEIRLTQDELNLLNSKDKIEKKSLERLQKQLEIRQLEQRIANLNFEKNIQQLRKMEDGTWEYQYVVDQDAIDEAESQLRDKKLDLIKFEEDVERNKEKEELDAKSEYFADVKKVVDKALNGEIADFKQFSDAMGILNSDFLNGMKLDSHDSWNSMFENMSGNIANMTNSFRTYVSDIESLAAQAEEALARMLSAQAKAKQEEAVKNSTIVSGSGKEYSSKEFGDLSPSERWVILDDEKSYLNYNGKKAPVSDALNLSNEEFQKKYGLSTGGYTGEDEGWNYLHKREIILNEGDTANFLKGIGISNDMMRKMPSLDLSKFSPAPKSAGDQVFHIDKLEFPNVTNQKEIEGAMKNIFNIAKMRLRTN